MSMTERLLPGPTALIALIALNRDVLRNGSILASRSPEWSGYPPTGIHRYDMEFALLEGDGSPRANLGTHPGAEEFYGADGSLARIVRRDHDARAPAQVDLDAYRTDQLEGIQDAEFKELMTAVTNALPLAPSFPAFSAIEVDALGYLWVREYNLPGAEGALWTVFDPDGIVQGFVETPPDLVIYEIGEDYIVGKVRDELRVEYVQLWELTRAN